MLISVFTLRLVGVNTFLRPIYGWNTTWNKWFVFVMWGREAFYILWSYKSIHSSGGKFLAFWHHKKHFIYFNLLFHNTPNINGSIFLATSFKYYFFILHLYYLLRNIDAKGIIILYWYWPYFKIMKRHDVSVKFTCHGEVIIKNFMSTMYLENTHISFKVMYLCYIYVVLVLYRPFYIIIFIKLLVLPCCICVRTCICVHVCAS